VWAVGAVVARFPIVILHRVTVCVLQRGDRRTVQHALPIGLATFPAVNGDGAGGVASPDDIEKEFDPASGREAAIGKSEAFGSANGFAFATIKQIAGAEVEVEIILGHQRQARRGIEFVWTVELEKGPPAMPLAVRGRRLPMFVELY